MVDLISVCPLTHLYLVDNAPDWYFFGKTDCEKCVGKCIYIFITNQNQGGVINAMIYILIN